MISGLLKLMLRLSSKRYDGDSEERFRTYFIIDDSLGSRKVQCGRSQPATPSLLQ